MDTCIPIPIQIWVKVNDVVEFEDLNFSSSEPVGIHCFAGKNIFFRRCSFTTEDTAICTEHGNRIGKTNGALKVMFEKCTFFNCEFGITVGVGGQVLLLDCVFTNCGTGLSVLNGGRVVAKHCDFSGCQRGARIGGRNSSGEFYHCSFLDKCHDGVTVTDGATLLADGCRVADCDGIGIIFEGPKRTFGHVMNTAVTKCNKSAVYVRDGKIDVVLKSCKFTENENGLITQWNVVGYVDLNGCVFSKSAMEDKELWNGPRCAVTEDSVLLPSQSLLRIKRGIRANLSTQNLAEQRLCKNAAVATVECFYCRVTEPEDVMFKKCGQCSEACYCSKECQVYMMLLHLLLILLI